MNENILIFWWFCEMLWNLSHVSIGIEISVKVMSFNKLIGYVTIASRSSIIKQKVFFCLEVFGEFYNFIKFFFNC